MTRSIPTLKTVAGPDAERIERHVAAREKLLVDLEIVEEVHGEAGCYYGALCLSATDQIILCHCSYESADRKEVSAYESIIWMSHARWAQQFEEGGSVNDASTSRWLMIVARSMEQKGACL